MTALVLRFLAGKYEGGEVVLPSTGEVLIGRSVEVPICLIEDLVSRKHARLCVSATSIEIEDLNSTNGTFVNGERVAAKTLAVGDRVLVGTNLLRLEPKAQAAAAYNLESSQPETPGAARLTATPTLSHELPLPSVAPSTASERTPGAVEAALDMPPAGEETLRGELGDVAVADVFALIAQAKHDGLLLLGSPPQWALFFEAGQLIDAGAMERPGMPADKSLVRIITLRNGPFVMQQQPRPQNARARLAGSSESCLLEASRQSDELEKSLQAAGLTRASTVAFTQPPGQKLSSLAPQLLDTLQLAIENPGIGTILDQSEADDLTVVERLATLVSIKFLTLRG